MRGAADRCMNIGLCRKSDAGVMCPSYMATRREEDSTRGRANALVKALSDARPAHRARRRAAARGARPVPDVQGVQERVPALGGHGHAQDRDPAPRARDAGHRRCAPGSSAASARSTGWARRRAPLSNLPAGCPPCAGCSAERSGIAPQRPLPVFARRTLPRVVPRPDRRPGAPRSRGPTDRCPSPTPSPASPSRPSGSPPSSCWSGPGGTCGWRSAGAAGGPRSPRACSTRRSGRRPACVDVLAGAPGPDRRVSSRPAC